MLFAGPIIETVRIPDIFHCIFENIRMGRHRYDVGIVVWGKDLQVFRAVEAPVHDKQDTGEIQQVCKVLNRGFIIAGTAVHR